MDANSITPDWSDMKDLIEMKNKEPEKYKKFVEDMKIVMYDFAKAMMESLMKVQKDIQNK